MSIKRKFYEKNNPEHIVEAYQNPTGSLYFYKTLPTEGKLAGSMPFLEFIDKYALCDGEPTDDEVRDKWNALRDWVAHGKVYLDTISGETTTVRVAEKDIDIEGLQAHLHASAGEYIYMNPVNGSIHAIDAGSFKILYLENTQENRIKVQAELAKQEQEKIARLQETLKPETVTEIQEKSRLIREKQEQIDKLREALKEERPIEVPSAVTKADPEKTEELHDRMKAVDISNEDVSNFDQTLLDLFVSQLYGKYIHRPTNTIVYAYQTRCQQELVGRDRTITAKPGDYIYYCSGGEIKVMNGLQFEKEFEPLSLQHDDRPDAVRYSYGELNPETNKIYFTPMIGTQLVLVHHYEDCYSKRLFLFEVPSGFACDLGDKVLVDTKYGKKEGVVKKVLWKDDLSSAAFDFLIKSSNARLPLKKVLGKFNYIDFDLECQASKKANERDEKIRQAWQEVVDKHNKWD